MTKKKLEALKRNNPQAYAAHVERHTTQQKARRAQVAADPEAHAKAKAEAADYQKARRHRIAAANPKPPKPPKPVKSFEEQEAARLLRNEKAKAIRAADPEKAREVSRRHYVKHREACQTRTRDWKRRNPERVAAYHKVVWPPYHKIRRQTDPIYNLQCKLRVHVSKAVRSGMVKGYWHGTTMQLLGCGWAFFKAHFESQFQPGMTWDDVLAGRVHVDHKKPVSSFDLTVPRQARECFHYSNLQPLWAGDNLSKGAKVLRNESQTRP